MLGDKFLVGGKQYRIVNNIKELLSLKELNDGDTIFVKGFYEPNDGGGGFFVFDGNRDKQEHNGGTIIAYGEELSDVVDEDWFTPIGGNGCFVRIVENINNVLWFGAKNDGEFDNYIIFKHIFTDMPQKLKDEYGYYPKMGTWFIPKGDYLISKPISIKGVFTIKGESVYQMDGTNILCEDTGFIIERYNTLYPDIQTDPTTGGDNTVIDSLYIKFIGSDNTNKYGIWLKARAEIYRTSVYGFYNGIHIVADARATTYDNIGNANSFVLREVYSLHNANHGVFVDGGDANAGIGEAINCVYNGGTGIYDGSFLGNTWLRCHTAANNQPYCSDDPNARSEFIGCYSESGQPVPSSFSSTSIVIGGLHAAGISKGPRIINGKIYASLYGTYDYDADGNPLKATIYNPNTYYKSLYTIGPDGHSEVFSMHFNPDNLTYYFKVVNYRTLQTFYTRSVENIFGRSSVEYTVNFPQIAIGDTNYGRHITYKDSIPTTGIWAAGDIIYKSTPDYDSTNNTIIIGWVCIQSGEFGTDTEPEFKEMIVNTN